VESNSVSNHASESDKIEGARLVLACEQALVRVLCTRCNTRVAKPGGREVR